MEELSESGFKDLQDEDRIL